MDIGNGWAGPGHTGATKDTTIINKAMMRFRPIAPKPVDNHSGSGSTAETNVADVLGKRRTKRSTLELRKIPSAKIKKKRRKKVMDRWCWMINKLS